MPLGQVTVPYVPGYAFGVGADLATGSPMGKVVNAPESAVARAAGATINFQVQRIQSTEELEQALGIDAEASYGSGAFGPNVSARFSYAKKAKIQSNSLFMVVAIHIELGFLSIDDPMLSQDAQTLVDQPADFKARYGNAFVRGIGRGGLFVGTMRMETESSEQSRAIAAELEGSYGLFSAALKTKFSEVQMKYRTSIFVDMYQEGGPIDLRIKNFTDPNELLENASRFLESFNTDADKSAVAYFVTLAPITIAKGPLPPNSAELEHAQDVLVACAKARSRLLDKINLLEYILDNTDRFDFTAGADKAAVQKALEDYQADLDLVAACASKAIKSPAEAAMPSYPRGTLPTLPVPKTAKTVLVPDFSLCKSWVECNEVATRNGLVAQQTPASIPPGETFKVIAWSPKGISVSEGSVVTIVTQPMKMRVFRPIALPRKYPAKGVNVR